MALTVVGGAQLAGGVELGVAHVDDDHLAGADDAGGLDGGQPDAAGADDAHPAAGLDAGGAEHGTRAGEHAAADERHLVERDVLGDLHDAVLVDEHQLGEAAEAGELADRGAVVAGAAATVRARGRDVAAGLVQRFGNPLRHWRHAPQKIDRQHTTWSPGCT